MAPYSMNGLVISATRFCSRFKIKDFSTIFNVHLLFILLSGDC